ncbi:hypothetical protein BT96DRAFT_949399 [Gymnopus androsaceus JB14]|uniref:Uncharacterized protein n=1 Tax=Gymnopus androsaceus JB14 TaxID=1447944 RepID=A0A6A4GKV4_9AGAR|nr:hypothetical protein BT96DRAFT_949399 [Gymnopus androsaceus JB14]
MARPSRKDASELVHTPAYADSKSSEDREAFVAKSITRYLKRFPVLLAMDKDSTAELLSKVDDNALEIEDALPAGDFAEETRKWNKRHVKEEVLATMTPEVVIKARLTGVEVTKPRRCGAHILWAADNQEQMEELRREKAAQGTSLKAAADSSIASITQKPANSVSNSPPAPIVPPKVTTNASSTSIPTAVPKVNEHASSTNASSAPSASTAGPAGPAVTKHACAPNNVSTSVNKSKKKKNKKKKGLVGDASEDKGRKRGTSRGYEALTPEEQELWEDLSEEDYDTCMAKYEELLTGAALTSPEACQRAINTLPQLAQGFLDLITEYTGMTLGFWAAEPEPKYGGKPNVILTTAGPAGKFLCKVYSIEECHSHALNKDSVLRQEDVDNEGETADKAKNSVQVDLVKGWDGSEGQTTIPKGGNKALRGDCPGVLALSDTIGVGFNVFSMPPTASP